VALRLRHLTPLLQYLGIFALQRSHFSRLDYIKDLYKLIGGIIFSSYCRYLKKQIFVLLREAKCINGGCGPWIHSSCFTHQSFPPTSLKEDDQIRLCLANKVKRRASPVIRSTAKWSYFVCIIRKSLHYPQERSLLMSKLSTSLSQLKHEQQSSHNV